jgi:hypothetical protein
LATALVLERVLELGLERVVMERVVAVVDCPPD